MRPWIRIAVIVACAALAACATEQQDYDWGGTSNKELEKQFDRRVAELRYQNGTELLDSAGTLVAYGDQAAPAVRRGLKSEDWLTRMCCAYVAGVSEDRRYIAHLRPLLSDASPDVRFEAAASLVDLRDGVGYYTLVDGLEDTDVKRRFKCIEVLQRNTGQDFGYVHDASPSIRQEAVLRWREWLKERQVEKQ